MAELPAVRQKRILNTISGLYKSSRPQQWLKNLAIFANLVFTGQFFVKDKLLVVFFAFVIFCLLSSASYIINDIIDASRDILHPFKSKRPIAAGVLSKKIALPFAFFIAFCALFFGFLLNPFFGVAISIFLLLQLSYSFWLKQLILFDVMAIAAGFLLRVYAGALIINGHVTVWFILAVTSVSLFLAIGKRRSERTLMETAIAIKHRGTLSHYPENLLDALTIMFATSSWLTYTMFTFLEPAPAFTPTVLIYFSEFLPRTLAASKMLMISVPVVIYIVMRYLYVIYEKKEGESPEKVLISDRPILFMFLLWICLVFLVIYGFNLEIFKDLPI